MNLSLEFASAPIAGVDLPLKNEENRPTVKWCLRIQNDLVPFSDKNVLKTI